MNTPNEARLSKLLREWDEQRRQGNSDQGEVENTDKLTSQELNELAIGRECLKLLDQVGPDSDQLSIADSHSSSLRILAHFRLDELIGKGGMGEVYRATDLALGRTCALKILPPAFPDALRARLVHEARICARLQHPSIATFYEAGQIEHQAYIAMEFVAGTTLRRRLRTAALSTNHAVSLVAGLLNGLAHAHALGILHRDIKPENIMLIGDDSAKLLDFGLAKSLSRNQPDDLTAAMLTEHGAVVGTVGYMSPEQLRGEELDERSDLFSVGAVLYEVITGRPAFPGRNMGERMAAILAKDPEPLTGSATLSQINLVLQRALAKHRDARYSSASAFLNDLKLSSFGELKTNLPNSLVVVDFENISGDPQDDWIGAGVAESIAAELDRVAEIEVAPRQKLVRQMARYESDSGAIDLQKLGLSLGCRWMVGGGYQKMGNSLRFTIYLKELLTDSNSISAKIDGSIESIFELQDRLAAVIRSYFSERVSTNADPSRSSIVSRHKTSAYECYVRGTQTWRRGDKTDFDQAQDLFEQAIALDSDYAPAYAGLATVHALRFTYTTDSTFIDATKKFAKQALALDANLSEALVWLGYAYINEYDIQKAFAQQLKAIELDRHSLFGHYFAGVCLSASHSRTESAELYARMHPGQSIENPHQWRFEQAVRFFQTALTISPDHGWSFLCTGAAHLALGNFTESQICLERARELDPKFSVPGVDGFLAETLRRVGQFEQARRCALKGIDVVDASDSMYRDTLRAIYLCCLGRAAMDEGDSVAAGVAFNQAVQHLEGRDRARGGGHPLVQALAGLAHANVESSHFERALQIYRQPCDWSFHYLPLCSADITLCALARSAAFQGDRNQAMQLKNEAVEYGSLEAREISI